MITMRYHVVSLAAAFLALAVGVVLGSTALSGPLLSGLADDNGQLGQRVTRLEQERNGLDAKLAEADRFASSIGPMAVRGQLTDRTVLVVSTSDAHSGDREALVELLGSAGALVTAQVELTDAFTDPRQADRLRDLVARSQPAGAELPAGADPGTRAGALIGTLLLLDGQNQAQATDDERASALTALGSAGFVKVAENARPAQLAVVLGGGVVDDGEDSGDRAATVARFATQLDRSGAGVVLAGRGGSAEGRGPIGVVRADQAAASVLSTVDNADSAAGRVVTVLALREQVDGGSGRYGVAGNAQAPSPGTT
ncbi:MULTISPECIES: copper transporter [Actinosynnema]|nr:copper transporter [Actinosynnema pretiosum]